MQLWLKQSDLEATKIDGRSCAQLTITFSHSVSFLIECTQRHEKTISSERELLLFFETRIFSISSFTSAGHQLIHLSCCICNAQKYGVDEFLRRNCICFFAIILNELSKCVCKVFLLHQPCNLTNFALSLATQVIEKR